MDNPAGPSLTTGLKESITKSHEQYEGLKIANSTNPLDVQKLIDDHTLGTLFIRNSDRKLFGQLLTDSHNDYMKGTDR